MRALEDTIAALGKPVLVRSLGAPAERQAVVARWRHGAAFVDVAPSDTIRIAMSLVDARNAQSRSGGRAADHVGRASISVFSPREGACVEVTGEADVVQLFLNQAYAEAALDAPFACPPMFDLHGDAMRSLLMQVLVGSAGRGPDEALGVEENLHALAQAIGRHAAKQANQSETTSALRHGGLSPAAFHRVEAMIETALDEAWSPTLPEMANAAGLSVTYFLRAFRQHTGSTPHKFSVRRRMDRAVSLLRTPKRPVAEVADQVGFSTSAHFVATFRATMGVTPGALREALVG